MARYRDYEQTFPTLAEALHSQTVPILKDFSTLLSKEEIKPTRKADLVAFVCRYLQAARLRAVWDKLDELQQAAVAEAAYSPEGLFQADRFEAKYGEQPSWGDKRSPSSYSRKPSLLAAFFYRNRIPDDLRRELQDFVPEPKEVQLALCETPPTHHTEQTHYWDGSSQKTRTREIPVEYREMETAARHDLRAVLGLIETGKITVSDKTRLPGAAVGKTLGEVLWGGDYYDDQTLEADGEHRYYDPVGSVRSFAWPLLVQAGGLTALSGKRLQLSKTGRKALTEAPEKTLRKLWQRWLKTTLLDELRRIDPIKGQTGNGKRGLTAVAGRRAAIDLALMQCPPGSWVEVDELFRYMQATGEDFEVSRNPWDLYIAEKQYGSLGYDGYHGWHILQGRYALCLLFEYAATLGIIDVAYIPPHLARPDYGDLWGTDDLAFLSRYDGLLYLRVTPLGAYCLGLTEHYTPAEPERRELLRVLPNLEIVAIDAGLAAGDQLLLDSYAERSSDAVWRLEQGKLLAAVEAGKSIAELRKILAARSIDPLPETVEHFLCDTAERATQLQDKGPARLIECADPALAALIANDSRCRNYCLLAGERHLVIYAATESRFRSVVRKLGYSLPLF